MAVYFSMAGNIDVEAMDHDYNLLIQTHSVNQLVYGSKDHFEFNIGLEEIKPTNKHTQLDRCETRGLQYYGSFEKILSL